MKIVYKDIILRDACIADIEDEIRWNTIETEWSLWDAPWEMSDELPKFDAISFRKKRISQLKQPLSEVREKFQIDTADGVHIGEVNSYLVNEEYDWVKKKDILPEQKTYLALGIEINESTYWGRGLGTQALKAFIQYQMDCGVKELCLQTWSGNVRMVKTAEKLGFRICDRVVNGCKIGEKFYDDLTFILR